MSSEAGSLRQLLPQLPMLHAEFRMSEIVNYTARPIRLRPCLALQGGPFTWSVMRDQLQLQCLRAVHGLAQDPLVSSWP